MVAILRRVSRLRRRTVRLALIAGCLVAFLTGCGSAVVSAQDRRVAFLKYVDADNGWQVFVAGAPGTERVSRTDEVREVRRLGGDLLAVETRGSTGRFFKKLNIGTGEVQTLYEPGKSEEFALFSKSGGKMLTVRQRPDHYQIEMWELTAPYGRAEIITSKTHLSPRAWPCSGRFAYFLESDTRKILRLDMRNKTLDDVTPPDLSPRHLDPNWFSISCDERTVAVSFHGAGLFAKLQVYRDGRVVHSVENAIEPDVSEDGGAVVYLDGYEPPTRKESDIPAQRIMQYDIHTDHLTELVGPTGFFSEPVFAE